MGRLFFDVMKHNATIREAICQCRHGYVFGSGENVTTHVLAARHVALND